MRISDWSSDVCSSDLCLGESLLGSEAFGIGSRSSMRTPGRFGALCIGKDPRLKPIAETVERILDAFDIAEVRSQPDNPRTRYNGCRISLIDSSWPQNIALTTRK